MGIEVWFNSNWQWIIALAAIAVPIVVAWGQKKQVTETIKGQTKQLHGSMLLRVFDTLSTNESRTERGKLKKFYCAHKENPNYDDNTDIRETADHVVLTFDKVCVLAIGGYLDTEEFEEIYGEMIVKFWKALKSDIKNNQSENRKGYARYFNELGKKLSEDSRYKETDLCFDSDNSDSSV